MKKDPLDQPEQSSYEVRMSHPEVAKGLFLLELPASGLRINLTVIEMEALRKYFARPKPLTPQERAEYIVRSFSRSYRGFDNVPYQVWKQLTDMVARGIEDAARLGVDWEYDGI